MRSKCPLKDRKVDKKREKTQTMEVLLVFAPLKGAVRLDYSIHLLLVRHKAVVKIQENNACSKCLKFITPKVCV